MEKAGFECEGELVHVGLPHLLHRRRRHGGPSADPVATLL
jgi:hypothetical protein